MIGEQKNGDGDGNGSGHEDDDKLRQDSYIMMYATLRTQTPPSLGLHDRHGVPKRHQGREILSWSTNLATRLVRCYGAVRKALLFYIGFVYTEVYISSWRI